MAPLLLRPHPDYPPADPLFKLWVNVDHAAAFGLTATTNMVFCVGAPASRFLVPEPSAGARGDDLWRSTCFEAFLRPAGERAYEEWNFAPSGDWNAYRFSERRTAMTPAEVGAPPYIRVEDNLTWWTLGATISVPVQRYALGLSAVLEEPDGTKSYWALAHRGAEPDFHDPDCFTATLA